MNHPDRHPRHGGLCRRAFLGRAAAGAGAFGLQSLLGRIALADGGATLAPRPDATAKRVIMIFINGGISHLDLFDDKPLLRERRGEEIPPSILKNRGVLDATERRGAFPVVGSKYAFKRYGSNGTAFSDLIPGIASVADELTVVKTVQTDFVLHESAISTLLTGTQLLGRPSWGSWVSYALGSANENVPEFVVLLSGGQFDTPMQPRLWGAGFLPGHYQGVKFRSGKAPVLDVHTPTGVTKASRRSVLGALESLNEMEAERSGDPQVETRIKAYEMAARMQTSIPELTEIGQEPEDVRAAYGADPGRPSFANNCLLARRLVERGVRFVQVCDGGWDMHSRIPRSLPRKCEDIDRPTGALIRDLKERGLLDDTLVILTSEFGRTPHCDGPLGFDDYGRDHHPLAGAALLAGGGVQRGLTYGETDEWGWDVIENPVHVHDLQATALHCLGLDHERLTFRHQGRDFRLTDVAGNVVHDLLART